MIDWNRGFQAGFKAANAYKSQVALALAALKDDQLEFVKNSSNALVQNDERIHQLEKRLRDLYLECAEICERRADSLRIGSDVARLCARDIKSRSTSI